MNLPTLQDLFQIAEQNGIVIDYFPIKGTALAIDLNGEYFIAVNPNLTAQKMREAIAHELGHCFTRGFYSICTPHRTIGYIEATANQWAYKKLLPIEWVKEHIKKGFVYYWEFAEESGLSEEFVIKAFEYYALTGLL